MNPAGKFGKAELVTVAPLVEEAEKHAVTRRNGRRERTCMENINGGVQWEARLAAVDNEVPSSYTSLYSRYSSSSAQLLDVLSVVYILRTHS